MSRDIENRAGERGVTVGRVVHYAEHGREAPFAALVVAVHKNGHVDLAVFDPDARLEREGDAEPRLAPRLVQHVGWSEDYCCACWSWAPRST